MSNQSELSERERDILRLVATGASNKEIAQQLVISPNTVKVHLRNIFAKIGVVSRTEATLYAFREGLVDPPTGMSVDVPALAAVFEPVPIPAPLPQSWWSRLESYRVGLIALAVVLLLIAGVGIALAMNWLTPVTTAQPPTQLPVKTQPTQVSNRWTAQPDLLAARSGAASVVYDDQIFLLAGEDSGGITGKVESFQPRTGTWTVKAAKSTPVIEVSAALIGEQIYLPGGKDAQGNALSLMEVYDPRSNTWTKKADLPAPRCGYALAVYEGRLFVFGGWDGQHVTASVFEYDAQSDVWSEHTPMPTARAYAAGAVAGGRIFVTGGWDGEKALAVNEAYYPQRDHSGETAWETRTALPEPRSGLSMTSLADMLYILGGSKDASPYQYLPLVDRWQAFEQPPQIVQEGAALVPLASSLYLMGGKLPGGAVSAANQTYQALYTVNVPLQ